MLDLILKIVKADGKVEFVADNFNQCLRINVYWGTIHSDSWMILNKEMMYENVKGMMIEEGLKTLIQRKP